METNLMPNVCNDFVSIKHGFHHLKYYDIVFFFVNVFLHLNLSLHDFFLSCAITFFLSSFLTFNYN
jgi:hypothetical protein